ncbi:MAG: hypothetical protein NC828_03185, partial [Candidatus Omnitrophica bacterium]|nr:hypothetical protein [Candidatus Omnitrophota bacterium]
MRKIILSLVIITFFGGGVCFAAAIDPSKIIIPKENGRIVDTYVSKETNAPLIVYLQDIHLNYEAQKAEVSILESLISDYGFDLVLLEGKEAGTDADFKYLRTRNSKEARAKGAEDLLKDGIITAVNYLDLATDYNFIVNGIESINLYKRMTEDQVAIFGNSENIIKLVTALQNVANNLKLHIYTKELRELDDKMAAYDKDEIGLIEYVKFLQAQASAKGIAVKELTNVALFTKSADLEAQIDFGAVETERATAVGAIEKAITDKTKKDEFLTKGIAFRTGDIS